MDQSVQEAGKLTIRKEITKKKTADKLYVITKQQQKQSVSLKLAGVCST